MQKGEPSKQITQNNTYMYTKVSSQQTFEIPNNNLDVRFDEAYHTLIQQQKIKAV